MQHINQSLRLLWLAVTVSAFFVSVSIAQAQAQVEIVNVDMLKTRLAVVSDTTFVVNMWATWCKPCVAELPYFERLSREAEASALTGGQKDGPVKVLLVSVDAKKDHKTKVEPFITKRGITAEVVLLWPMGIDGVDTTWSGAIPATLIVKGSRRGFYEREFTFDELKLTVDEFIQSATKSIKSEIKQ